jgi:pterin-4a-carbinolamine dehydratase
LNDSYVRLTDWEEVQTFLFFNLLAFSKFGLYGTAADYIRELYRYYEFRSYDDAWKFIVKVDEHGIRVFNHHPRWLNTYNRVEFWLCTFHTGHKPSQRDITLAEFLEETYP